LAKALKYMKLMRRICIGQLSDCKTNTSKKLIGLISIFNTHVISVRNVIN
jgi:hypothetical protein